MELNFDVMCRLCLKTCANRDVFLKHSEEPSCYQMISNLSVPVLEDDGLPRKICPKCYSKLLAIHKFKLMAIESYNYLSDLKDDSIKEETGIGDIKSECAVGLAKIETIESNENDAELDVDFENDNDADDDDEDDIVLSEYRKEFATESKENDDLKSIIGKKSQGNEKRLKICDHCGKQVVNINQHMRKHDNERHLIPCTNCDRTFLTYSSRNKHNMVHHMGLLYYCEICKKHYKHGPEHRRIVHSDREKRFKCSVCDKAFFTRSNLEIHASTHSKIKPFQCSECGKTFRLKYCMLYHKRRVHEGEKSHICQYCSKGFFSREHLRVHLRSHTKEKIFKCGLCPKMFSTISTKKGHERRHSGVKNYKCQYCKKEFYEKSALKVHSVSHTLEKNYECKYCKMKFGRSDHRNRHQRTAHEKTILSTFPIKDF